MKEITLKIKDTDFVTLQKLATDFSSYYEDNIVWTFKDLDEQREIALAIIQIIKTLRTLQEDA